ncbi:protocatechuate 3,4-dioxygenase [Paucibacter sp. PLA-PC-4]|uniref:protocatechuate 3,4-dioxygenase n=1 Tax=Paucibacter sp. PLA-PC-4 TaxID=2993655 RepID=UPI00224914B6|nr:protocatechuate 3,4-dioxygenase [Paucibacter sp. PLA-PC-4]MCX2860994.1 protocatechuate 3,4-dioxygenase [Paucibacter sp. PLA-PC-4]
MSDNDCMLTSSQTIGPFPHEAWRWAVEASTPPGAAAVVIAGRLLDGAGEPVNDGWIEAWTPGAVEAGPLPGFRRVPTGEQGEFVLRLSRAVGCGEPAAHITVFARGLLKHQFSAVFLVDTPGLAGSALLTQVPEARRASLLALPDESPGHYRWDIRLQGEGETVFFDYR